MSLGINLTLLIGQNTPRPAPSNLIEAFKSAEITHSDDGYSGFQITFHVGRAGKDNLLDYKLIKNPLIAVYNRVILIINLGAKAKLLMDGIITHHQFSFSLTPGDSTFTITGEDVSVMMDLEEKSVEHTAQDEATIARVLIGNYAKYGLIPKVIAPSFRDQPTRNERIPSQQSTDLEYLKTIAQRFAYVFYITPGPAIGQNTAYWGPPQRKDKPQKALTVNMESFSNVDSISFQNNALSATAVKGSIQDRKTNKIRPLQEYSSDRPSLAAQPALARQAYRRTQQFRQTGRETAQADALIQAIADRSVDNVVTVTGELDTIRYGTLLEARRLVGLRGVGATNDGLYYVKSVTHKISQGEYKQNFTITRDGIGTTIQKLPI
ncbi:phage late control D family protein [Aerosakkonemataceae cyanobacterium BLCC-F50]|uniref:Phage late control D family protein n=1 Tax=Floridaenema flaviceps BLCC-F50 TaxID=3153642 RepID=A0ABV4XT17_9CYAN